MKPIITIDNFSAGILADATEPATNGGQMFCNLDIHRETSTISVSQKLTQQTDIFTGLVKWIVRDENEADYKYWALDENGKLYKAQTIDGTWAVDSAVGGHGNGMIVYNGSRYYAFDDQLKKAGGGTETLDSDTSWHPMIIYLGSLWIGGGRYLSKLESDETFTQHALTLPLGYKIKSLRVYGDKLMIGTWKGTNVYDEADSLLFSWNGSDTFPDEPFGGSFNECGMNALELWENIMLVFAGTGGNVYAFNQAFLDKAKVVPDVFTQDGDYGYINPDAVAQLSGNCLMGYSIGSGSGLGGIYTFGRKTEDLPFAMTLSHLISTGSTDIEIGSVFTGESNKFLVSWKDGSDYGLDALDTTAKATMGYFHSQQYEIMNGRHKRLIKAIQVVAEPLPDDTSIVVKYKTDHADDWTTGGTITSNNQNSPVFVSARANVFQIRLELNTNNNDSPKIKVVEIY